jgi:hypothetical protein
MRPLLLALAITSVLASPAISGEGGGEPPVVAIYDQIFTEVDILSAEVDELFSLIGTAVGDVPLYYFWYEDELIATGNILLDCSFSEPGEYVITLDVVDVNGLTGSDSVLVIVTGAPVPYQAFTWSRIKAMFQLNAVPQH